MTRLTITLLGAPRFECDGTPLDITARKSVALLAYLAATGVPHTRDALATVFWPEADQERARGALRYTLAQLKAALGEGWLQISREQIGLIAQADLFVDVAQVEALLAQVQGHGHPFQQVCAECLPMLEQAMTLQRGTLLAGFTLSDSPAFDDWLFFETERLQRLQIDALATLVAYHRTAGTLAAAIPYAQRWMALDPLEETANQLLLQLYVDSDQPAAARRHYAAFAQRLHDELGFAPDPATSALIKQLDRAESHAAATNREQLAMQAPQAQPRQHLAATLPLATTPLLGRAHEVDAIETLLADPSCRLLTLLGPGGSGKTRLALAVAQARQAHNATVVFVPLAGLTTPSGLVAAVAAAVGCPPQTSGDPQQHLLDFLGAHLHPYLLVLDNLEHLLHEDGDEPGAVVTLLDGLLRNAPAVQVLATSRVRLQLYEEQVYPVYGLEYPESGASQGIESYSAVQLFVQRARRAQSDFALTHDTTSCVTRIVRLLAGQPLAIELAAAWVTTLALDEIAAELSAGIDLLKSEARNIPARHRSMRATYMISWEQLQPNEQAVQEALAVFRGGFTYQAAAQVAGATPRVLQMLINHSLLERPHAINGSLRYQVHELLRQFAAEKLAHDPQRQAQARDRHAAYYLAMMETAVPTLEDRPNDEYWAQVRMEYDNQLAALQWMLQQKDSEGSLRLCIALWHLWEIRGQVSEGHYWTRAALALPSTSTSVVRVDALDMAGRLAVMQEDWEQAVDLLAQALTLSRTLGDMGRVAHLLRSQGWLALTRGAYGEATELLEESVALYRSLGDKHGIARALGLLGQAAYEQQAFAQAVALLTESMTISRALDEPIDTAWSIYKLGLIALYQRHFSDADRLLTESLAIFEAIDYKGEIAWVIGSLGWMHLGQGMYARAAELFEDSFVRWVELGSKRNIAISLDRLASLASAQGQAERAARLFGAASGIRQALAVQLSPVLQAQFAPYLATLHAALGAEGVVAASAEGAALSVERAIAYALDYERH